MYSKDEIILDIDFLIEEIEKVHPNPFHSISKEDFLGEVMAIKAQIPDSLSKVDAWKHYYVIVALLKEGHTFFLPPFGEIGDYRRFPYTIKMDMASNSFIVNGSKVESIAAPLGNKIASINGISTDSIISIFRRSISAENDAFFAYSCEKHFDFLLFSIFDEPKYFDIELIGRGKVETQRCQSINQIPEKLIPNYEFEYIKDSIGLITMNTLDSFEEFEAFSKLTFKELNNKKIPNLIIDFRGNLGGDSRVGDELMRYFSKVPFIQYQKAAAKVSPASRERLYPEFENDTIIEVELSEALEYFVSPYPEELRYSGKVFVLIDGGTFSSAGSTVWCMKHYSMATFIGTETGGMGVHYGYPIPGRLPKTGLTYFISHMKWYQIGADDKSYHGLFPDYTIGYAIEDIKENKDTALKFALELINNAK